MRDSVRSLACCASLALGACALGCNTYADSLSRAQKAFEQSEQDRALAILRTLEPDASRFSTSERAHYCYLRGMTDYRIGYRLEARHWLQLASAIAGQTPESLPADWTKRMKEALKDLDEAVYTGGMASLSNTPGARKAPAKDADDADTTPAAEPTAKPKATDE